MTAVSTRVLNHLLVGQERCGYSVVQSSISAHPDAVCLAGLLEEDEKLRKANCEWYFGKSHADAPQWYAPDVMSAEQYLTTRVFDHPRYREKTVGVTISYADMQRMMLWEYMRERTMAGDFVVIHVRRNPIACFVSQKQKGLAEAIQPYCPSPVSLDAKELIEFCRQHDTAQTRIENLYDDRLEIDYRELFLNYNEVMAAVFDFLELDPYPNVRPSSVRLLNKRIKDRISNWDELYRKAPYDVKLHFDDKYLF